MRESKKFGHETLSRDIQVSETYEETKNIKVSAIIPHYNTPKEIFKQCIDSILQQDFQDYEIIIVDDGSEEAYIAYLLELEKLDSRIKVIKQNNQGVSAARNAGVECARGEYITFIDSDDFIVPYFFSEAYHIAKENDADYVLGLLCYTTSRNPTIERVNNLKIEIKNVNDYRAKLVKAPSLKKGMTFGRGPVARFIRRKCLESVFFPEGIKWGEDIIWNLDVLTKCNKICIVHQVWYIYWKNQDSATNKYNSNVVEIGETHLLELIKRMNLENEEELAAYYDHIYKMLRFMYRCYFGRDESGIPIYKRYRLFTDLCKKEPWKSAEKALYLRHCSMKCRIQCLFTKLKLAYWLLYINQHLKSTKNVKICFLFRILY